MHSVSYLCVYMCVCVYHVRRLVLGVGFVVLERGVTHAALLWNGGIQDSQVGVVV